MELPVTESAERYTVIKQIPVSAQSNSVIEIGTIVTILSNTRGNNTKGDMAFNIYDKDRIINQITPNNMKKYITEEYLKLIKTAGGRRRTRKHKRRHTKKCKQSRRRKN